MGEGLTLHIGQENKVISLNQGKLNIPLTFCPSSTAIQLLHKMGFTLIAKVHARKGLSTDAWKNLTFFFFLRGDRTSSAQEYILHHLYVFYHQKYIKCACIPSVSKVEVISYWEF